MLSIAHGPTGAFIASKIPNPFISVPLCIAAHFIEDFVPHWDVGTGLTKKVKSKKSAFLQELFTDFPLSILIVYFFFQHGHPFDWHIWLGWFAALAPDFIEFPHLFLKFDPWPMKYINEFHKSVHHSIPDVIRGVVPQLIVLGVIYLFR
jgi:hypothetical protein